MLQVNNLIGFGASAAAPVVTSYANTGGQGNRTGIITTTGPAADGGGGVIANVVNGATSVDSTNSFLPAPGDTSNLTFDFGSSKVIDEITWFQNNTNQNSPTFQMRASPDNAAWTNFGSTFTISGSTTNVLSQLAGNQTGYRYYQFQRVSGTWSNASWVTEIEFKIGP